MKFYVTNQSIALSIIKRLDRKVNPKLKGSGFYSYHKSRLEFEKINLPCKLSQSYKLTSHIRIQKKKQRDELSEGQ